MGIYPTKYSDHPDFPEVRKWVIEVRKEKSLGAAAEIVRKVGGYQMLAHVKPYRYPKIIAACKKVLEEKTYFGQHAFTVPGLRDHSLTVYP